MRFRCHNRLCSSNCGRRIDGAGGGGEGGGILRGGGSGGGRGAGGFGGGPGARGEGACGGSGGGVDEAVPVEEEVAFVAVEALAVASPQEALRISSKHPRRMSTARRTSTARVDPANGFGFGSARTIDIRTRVCL